MRTEGLSFNFWLYSTGLTQITKQKQKQECFDQAKFAVSFYVFRAVNARVESVLTFAVSLHVFRAVSARVESAFEELNSNDSKHELQQESHQHDVADRLHGHNRALDNTF